MTAKRQNKSNKPQRIAVTKEPDEFVYAAADVFFSSMQPDEETSVDDPSGKKTKKRKASKGCCVRTANELNERFGRDDMTRERIYPLIWEAMRRNFVVMNAPIAENLSKSIIEKFNLGERIEATNGAVTVVNVVGNTASRRVGEAAADSVVTLIDKVRKEKEARAIANGEDPEKVRVHLGLGAGFTAMTLADRLSTRFSAETPKLMLHALTPGGYYFQKQQNSPTSYFQRFFDKQFDVECQGMFAPPIVGTDNYERLRVNPSLRANFTQRDDIDILVTSLATAKDPHGLVRQYFIHLRENGHIDEDVVQSLEKQNWVGDVLFQPYSATQPIYPKTLRTVSLFNFQELVEFSNRPGKHVVVIGAPCGECHASKASAILPLLKEPSMRLWTRLFIDRDAAIELLQD